MSRWESLARGSLSCCARREGFEGQEGTAGKRGGAGKVGPRGLDGLRHRWKRGEPQGRKRVAIYASRQGGVNRRGGAEPRGRNVGATWQSHPEGGRAAGQPDGRAPGVDSLASKTTEGRSLDNPKRGSSDHRAGNQTDVGDHGGKGNCIPNRSSSRRTGSRRERRREGRQVERASPIRMFAPRMMVLEGSDDGNRHCSKAMEGSSEGQRAAASSCASPRVRGLRACTG